MSKDKKSMDLYRDSLVRYLGYSHVVGSALSGQYALVASGITAAYVFSDTMNRANTINTGPLPKRKKDQTREDQEAVRSNNTIKEVGDSLLWHSIATILIPSFIVVNARWATCRFISNSTRSLKNHRSFISKAVALATIPIFSRPVDRVTDEVMNGTYRSFFHQNSYVGYSAAITEALKSVTHPHLLDLAKGATIGYTILDIMIALENKPNGDHKEKATAIADTFIWQLFASLFLPRFVICNVTWITHEFLYAFDNCAYIQRIVPTGVALLIMPFVFKPIDSFVECLMDKTFRMLKDSPPSNKS